MRKTIPSAQRERTIRNRQDPPAWGVNYLPGQLAVREEAPDYSRFHSTQSFWLKRRVHLMSQPESHAYLLGSWLSVFFDMHEGRMIHPEASYGFLAGCPGLDQTYTAAHQGSIAAADKLGLLQFHPVLYDERKLIAFPMLGDQLYFARDELGIYAVNWCIKDHVTDFVNAFKMRGNKERAKSNEAHQARLLIEFEVFRDAGIKTVQVSSDDIPFHLRHNLRLIYPWCERSHGLLESMSRDFIETLIERIPKNVPVIETMKKFSINHGGTLYDYSTCFYQAVWQRQIRCDLLRPLAIDMPLKPTTKKIEESFSTWCSRINQ